MWAPTRKYSRDQVSMLPWRSSHRFQTHVRHHAEGASGSTQDRSSDVRCGPYDRCHRQGHCEYEPSSGDRQSMLVQGIKVFAEGDGLIARECPNETGRSLQLRSRLETKRDDAK